MGRSIFAGFTDYSHQSFKDIVMDLQIWIKNLMEVSDFLPTNIQKLKESKYWDSVNANFQSLVQYSIKFYDTSIQEISEIAKEIQEEVRPNHIVRIRSLYKTASELDLRYGRVWYREDWRKEYGDKDFKVVEKLYQQGRSMAIDMGDLSNLAARLEDFVGKKVKPKQNPRFSSIKKWTMNHPLVALLVAIIAGVTVLVIGYFFFKNK